MTGTRPGHDRLGAPLLIDAATCAASGAVAIAAAGPIADLLGVDSQAWVRGTGVFLVVYSLALWSLTRAHRSIAVRGAAATAVGDGVWVAATVALVVAGVFSGVGTAVMIAMGLLSRHWARRRSTRLDPPACEQVIGRFAIEIESGYERCALTKIVAVPER